MQARDKVGHGNVKKARRGKGKGVGKESQSVGEGEISNRSAEHGGQAREQIQ